MPGKIDASLNEKLSSVKWGEYRIGDLFTVNSSQGIFHANKIEEIFNFRIPGSFPYIVRSTKNNGLRGYIVRNEKYLNEGQTLSFAQDTFTVFYQKEKYFTGNKIKILKPRFSINNESIMSFLVSCFKCTLNSLSWGIGSTISSISNMKIKLPTKQGKIDFDFMESFIAELEAERVAELEAERVAELEAYLKVSGFEDYELSDKEKHSIDNYSHLEWKEYSYNDFFKLEPVKNKLVKSCLDKNGEIPVFSAESSNNGIIGYTSKNPDFIISKENNMYIVFGDHTRSFNIANKNFCVMDNVKILKPNKVYSLNLIFYIISVWKKCIPDKGYTRHWKIAKNQKIYLPVKNGKIDFDFIETFISAIKKLVIKNVVLYKDKKIEATKKIINNEKMI